MRSIWLPVVLAAVLALIGAGVFVATRVPHDVRVTIDLEFDHGKTHEVFLDGRSLGPAPIVGLDLLYATADDDRFEPTPSGGPPDWPPARPASECVTTRTLERGTLLHVLPFLDQGRGELVLEILVQREERHIRRTHVLTFPAAPPGHTGSSAYSGVREGVLVSCIRFEVEVP